MPIPVAAWLGGAALLGGGAILTVKAVKAGRTAADKAAIRNECERLRIALETATQAGHSPAEIRGIQVAMEACARRAGTAGVDIGDTELYALLPCRQQREYLDRVFADYKSTSYADPLARDSKRGAMFTAADEMIRCLTARLAEATTPEQVRTILAEINIAAAASRERAVCYFEGGTGCGRFAENEAHGNERGMQELERIGARLGAQWYGNGPGTGYEALGFGERFRAAANLNSPEDRARPLREGDYGGLRREAENKLASFRPTLTGPVATTVVLTPALQGLFRTINLGA